MIKIVFVHSIYKVTRSYSHAIASVAAALQESCRDATISVVTIRSDDPQTSALEIVSRHPDVVLFTAMSNQWLLVMSVATELRKVAESPPLLVAGGIHVTARPNTIGRDIFDLIVVGEGEKTIADLIISRIGHGGAVAQRGQRCEGVLIESLDSLPLPLLEIFEREDVLAYPSLMFSRGCPFHCQYCMSRDGGLGGRVRWKSPERAIQEVEQIVACFSPPELYFDDDTILKNPGWIKSFTNLYRQKVGRPFYCNARPETVRRDIVAGLQTAGCVALGIGIESGSERIRKILGRPMDDDVILRSFAAAKQVGLKTWSFNMVGIPGESADDLRQTIKLNDLTATDYVRVSIYTPYPGSPLGSDVEVGVSGYFRSPETLPPEMRDLYMSWIARLQSEGRLWLTESERSLVLNGS